MNKESHVTLGAHAAKTCPKAIHNEFCAPATSKRKPTRTDELTKQRRIEFKHNITAAIENIYGDDPGLLVVRASDRDETVSSTISAMDLGVPLIVGGRLPDVDGRSGAPDVLVRSGKMYLPVDIKGHKVIKATKQTTAHLSWIDEPDSMYSTEGVTSKYDRWLDDAMQLAHYTHMLHSLGYHYGRNLGGIIGAESLYLDCREPFIIWHYLDASVRGRGQVGAGHQPRPTVMEWYRREFSKRARVAAATRSGTVTVQPFHIEECSTCPWLDHCRGIVPSDDASFSIETGLPNRAMWSWLYGRRRRMSILELADLPLANNKFRPAGNKKLVDLRRRAQMTVAGTDLELKSDGWPEAPSADVEIDFDIQWDIDGRIYQWGLRIRNGQDESTVRYVPVVSFEQMGDDAEQRLSDDFCDKLGSILDRAAADGETTDIYHWSAVERSRTKKFPRVAELLDGRTTDLLSWFNANFFSRTGASIKDVAPMFGFQWGVEEPGGKESQWRIIDARNGDETCRQWCLDYNESDVAAQAAIRDGLARRTPRTSRR